ncbi:hypothetical protein GCM10027059_05100 [Myceligenerans halotolerans]
MIDIPAGRLEAARVLTDFLTSEEGRGILERNNYESGTPLFPASEAETVYSVVSRMRQDDGDAAVVAVYFPSRPTSLAFIEFSKKKAGGKKQNLPTGGDATIGMLADYLIKAKHRVTISVQQEISAEAFELASA